MAQELKIVVIDYQSGNLRSVAKALEAVGASPVVTEDASQIESADAVILPGVGSGPAAMRALETRGLVKPIKQYVAGGRPFLGVCLGLQLLLERTDEGDAPCLGIVPGQVRRLPGGMKVPHMGWNSVDFEFDHPVFRGIPPASHFYFVHSYYADPDKNAGVAGTTTYGIPFCSAFARDNLVATQFHPEKSGTVGLRIYRNFLEFAGNYSA
ncbi:Imidazole glycerol phosphate synthase subunit HisH [Geodia barretti]|uniref:Imidazole glycerol phosphate synthase subunit HisH n=3 Tax=Geodia barretti TaxID=519541 RepID=A0AA35S063_GEOBA|nr:Imidazole glycerol phosphate synthase subunit HisH [Geodia barretti]